MDEYVDVQIGDEHYRFLKHPCADMITEIASQNRATDTVGDGVPVSAWFETMRLLGLEDAR